MSLGIEITEELIARQPPEARAIIRALSAQNAVFAEQIATLKRRVAELEDLKLPTS